MTKLSILLAVAAIAGGSTVALAQGPKPGDAQPPGALKQGGISPAAAMRRGDDMSPTASSSVGMTTKTSHKKKTHHQM